MKFGVFTGGGDSAGINDFLYFLAQRLNKEGHSLIGFRNSWEGLIINDCLELKRDELEAHRFTPGTVLGTVRRNPVKEGKLGDVQETLEEREIDVLIAMGGDDTLGVANRLAGEGLTVIGVPQTIDNDLQGTERTLGFATAVRQASYTVNSLVNSNIAHDREMFVEAMGREAGWLALAIALNTPACACMCPEGRMDLAETIEAMRNYKRRTGRAALAVVSEGISLEGYDRSRASKDAFGNVAYEGISHGVADEYKKATGRTCRVQVLGYLMRGGTTVPEDVQLAAAFANTAVDLALSGRNGEMVGLVGSKIHSLPLSDVMGAKKTVPLDYLNKQLELLAL